VTTQVRQERGLAQELQGSHRAMLVALCAIVLLALLASGYLLFVSQPQVARYTHLTGQARLLHEAMLDQETGLRGWLATGDPIFLEPYRDGAARGDGLSQSLVAGAAESPQLTNTLLPLLLTRAAWQQWARAGAAWKVPGNARTNGELGRFLLRGKGLFDLNRAADAKNTDYLVHQRDKALADQRNTVVSGLVGLVVLLGGAGVWALRRRRQMEGTVLTPMRQMLETIRELRAGELSARTRPTGVHELDAVGSALGSFADDLLEANTLAVAREARMALLAERLETVIKVARETSGSLNVRYVSETVAAAAATLLGVPTTLWVRNDEGQFRATRRSDDPHGTVPSSDLLAPALVAAVAADARTSEDDTWRAYPLVLAGMVIGVLQAELTTVDADSQRVLEALLSTAAAAMESARLHSSARELAEIDALTQLPNRRRLESDLVTEWERCRRYNRPLTFIMLDLDNFKQLNDTFGHLVGDTILNGVATAISTNLRGTDTAYRYGGEEIAVMLRETDLDNAMIVAERIRQAVADLAFPGTKASVTASLGVAQLVNSMAQQSELVEQADAALYRSKREGRDRTTAARLVSRV
jgi:diguanylate cyclase (GGDEF)-like protein